jgi:putative ABC transport system permease protein
VHPIASAIRSLNAAPAVTGVIVLTLALGIGANTAIFSVVNSLLLRTLPVPAPEQLVTISSDYALSYGFKAGGGWSHAMWTRLQDAAPMFDGVLAWSPSTFDLSRSGEKDPARTLLVSGDFFKTLGIGPHVGRLLTRDDDVRGGGRDGAVAVISDRFWAERFGRTQQALGSTLSIEGVPFTIVGVTPPEFLGIEVGQAFDVAIPLATDALVSGARSLIDQPRSFMLTVIARRKPGQSLEAATAALQSLQPMVLGVTRDRMGDVKPSVLREPFLAVPASTGISDSSRLRIRYQRPLLALAVLVALVLLVACVNVASVLLARATARQYEFGVRLALGATRARLVMQLMVESLLLSIAGAAAGLVLAYWGSRALVAQLSVLDTELVFNLDPDWRVLGFTAAISMLTALLFGTAPALRATRLQPVDAMRGSRIRGASDGSGRLTGGLIVVQIAISVMIVIAAGLFVRTFGRLLGAPLGFDSDRLLLAEIDTSQLRLDPAQRLAYYEHLAEAIRSTPGVAHAAASITVPLSRASQAVIFLEQDRVESIVGPGYFAAYGTALVSGRDFEAQDSAQAAAVAIVNQAYARKFFPDGNALGATAGKRTIVGVVRDAVFATVRGGARPTIYIPLAQSAGMGMPGQAVVTVTVRAASGAPALLMRSVSATLKGVEPQLTYSLRAMQDHVDASVSQERVVAALATLFGGLALLLAGLGLYGVTSYAVSRRRFEIGIRMALGAQRRDVLRLVLGRTVVITGIGMVVGLVGAIAGSRSVEAMLFGVVPLDPATFVGVVAVLVPVGVGAAFIPARRATRIDPMIALRDQ